MRFFSRKTEGGEKPPRKNQLCCSFCGKSKDKVAKFISGPGVYICNECVELCNRILQEDVETQQH